MIVECNEPPKISEILCFNLLENYTILYTENENNMMKHDNGIYMQHVKSCNYTNTDKCHAYITNRQHQNSKSN